MNREGDDRSIRGTDGKVLERPIVNIEVPRFGIVKRAFDGRIAFVSPWPCPYNYGSIEGTVAADGDPADAIVLGSRLARGARVRTTLRGVVGFVDAGVDDPKWVCSAEPLTGTQRASVERFFRRYAVFKRGLYRVRSPRSGPTYSTGWSPLE